MTGAAEEAVRAALAGALPLWFGPGARLASLGPARQHAWSHQFALEAHTASGRRRLVVKVPRWEGVATLEEAVAAGPQEATRQEHAALVAVVAAVDAAGDSGLAAVVPVGYLAGVNAVVTERLEAVPLRSLLGWGPGGVGRRVELLQRAGRWLRLYHDRVAGAEAGALDGCALAAEVERLPAGRRGGSREAAALARRARERHGAPAAVGATHGDFNLSNVLATPDGRVAALDPNLVPGPLLEDAAKFLTDLRMRRGRAVTMGVLGRGGLRRAEAAFLDGYGGADPALLRLLQGVAALRRGAEMEERLAGAPGLLRRAATAVVRRYVAAELARLAS